MFVRIGPEPIRGHDKLWDDLWFFDVQTLIWTQLTTTKGKTPCPRAGHSCVLLQDQMFLYGGVSDRAIMSDLHILNITTLTWSKVGAIGTSPGHIHSQIMFKVLSIFYFYFI